eukprot:SAG31_NODE_3858_length_3815_cov_2.457212_2_plen_67_part_00
MSLQVICKLLRLRTTKLDGWLTRSEFLFVQTFPVDPEHCYHCLKAEAEGVFALFETMARKPPLTPD